MTPNVNSRLSSSILRGRGLPARSYEHDNNPMGEKPIIFHGTMEKWLCDSLRWT
jgi:hypothetical protein